jgi:hypothetical protein
LIQEIGKPRRFGQSPFKHVVCIVAFAASLGGLGSGMFSAAMAVVASAQVDGCIRVGV